MEDEEDMTLGGLGEALGGLGALDAGKRLADFTEQYQTTMADEASARERAAAERRARFEQAEKFIREQRFGMPTTSEQLFQLSAALLTPRRWRGFGSTMANVMPVLSQQEQARRSADEKRAEMMLKLQTQYAGGEEEARLAALESKREGLGDLLRTYGSLAKPQRRRSAFNPLTGELTDTYTGEVITPVSSVPPAAIEQLKNHIADPSVPEGIKRESLRNFERRFKVDPIAVLQGGM